ncbi:MAG: hypothetical protein AAFR87_13275 [Bacteroidota bacterium]
MNTNILRYYLLSIVLLVGISLPAQNYLSTPEYLYAQFDKEFYVAGEDMWFSVYFANPGVRQSEIVYAELYSPDSKEISRHMLKVEGNRAYGDFILPANIKTGYYTFRAYTRWNLNFSPQQVFTKEIAIYNAEASSSRLAELPTPEYSPANSENLRITLAKSSVKPREKISIKVSALAQGMGNASISITDLRYLTDDSKSSLKRYLNEINSQTAPSLSSGQQVVEPEKSLEKTFMLRHPDTEEYVNSNFVMGFVKQTQQKLIRVAENGIVDFPLDAYYDSTVVQIFDANPFQASYIPLVAPVNKELAITPPAVNSKTPPITDAVRFYIQEYQKRFQIGKLFGNLDLIRAKQVELAERQFRPTNTYRVDDFISLSGMEEFIKQAVPPVNVKDFKIKGTKVKKPGFKLYIPHKEVNTNNKVVKKRPLLLVNDYFTYDSDAVLGLDWSNIETIEVFNSVDNLPMQFGPIGEFGVIAFNTRDGKTPDNITATGNNLMIPGFYRPRLVNSMDYSSRTYMNSKIPDFRPMIYWNPLVPLNGGSETELQFSVGDQTGLYLIRVEGFLDSGAYVSGEAILNISLNR